MHSTQALATNKTLLVYLIRFEKDLTVVIDTLFYLKCLLVRKNFALVTLACLVPRFLLGIRARLVSYPGLSLGESYPSVEKQSVYSTAPADWASARLVLS